MNQAQNYGQLQGNYNQGQQQYYDQAQGNPAPIQQVNDPSQSGVQPSINQPGQRVDMPGRETGTAWGEDQQNGYTTDTSDRRNPAD